MGWSQKRLKKWPLQRDPSIQRAPEAATETLEIEAFFHSPPRSPPGQKRKMMPRSGPEKATPQASDTRVTPTMSLS